MYLTSATSGAAPPAIDMPELEAPRLLLAFPVLIADMRPELLVLRNDVHIATPMAATAAIAEMAVAARLADPTASAPTTR